MSNRAIKSVHTHIVLSYIMTMFNCKLCLYIPTVQIRLERNTYTASEVDGESEEICAVLIAASNTDIDAANVLMEIGITTIIGTITPREVGGANAATGKFIT